jgi:succinoglycan biosynthesis protein ExoM
VTVAICVATYARPEGLRRVLASLAALEPAADDVRVVVVDNDAAGSAREAVEGLSDFPWRLEYAVEPRRGISAARNEAVRRAGGVDFVAFVDDDEWVERTWLAELLCAQERTGADVVVGPVVPAFETPPPSWFAKGRFLQPYEHGPDELLWYAYTGNALVRRGLLEPADAPFSERFGLLGGEDTHFFMRVYKKGAKIVWAQGARVHESIPAERLSESWLVRREYRRGNTLSLCLRDLEDSPLRRVKRVGHGMFRIGQGAALTLASPLGGRATLVRGLQRIAFGTGLLTGLGLHSFRAYGGEP